MSGLVLGSSGQLATHLRGLLPDAQYWGRGEFDLTEPAGLTDAITAQHPAYIVNAAAYTAVDRAESEPELAWRINVDAPAAAARAAAALDVPLIHVSTDYVFDGTRTGPYETTDPTCPLNAYGRTKLAGELAVTTHATRCWVLRTSWVFSEHGHNFVKTMLRLGGERDALSIVADQIGVPTYAGDLAAVIAALLERTDSLEPGIAHAVGGPAVSWCGFAEQIFALGVELGLLQRAPQLSGIPSSGYPTPARRPANSQLAPSRSLLDRTAAMDWRAGLRTALTNLRES